MMYNVDGIAVKFNWIDDATEEEARNYVNYVCEHVAAPEYLKSITVSPTADGLVDVNYELQGPKFERIRRITGYLTGSLDTWNDSKQEEERDRVKHGRIA